ncbi:Seizure protein 6-like [Holothuria leucospilota]|uniref:Seizure protein 6-like n=1 Tax=Holothuria leucospilota TaxID=206669 RepID=A0A9Q1BR63_HOLLE|nr:Seizure protein 6-like [Holothuria leucospilota]
MDVAQLTFANYYTVLGFFPFLFCCKVVTCPALSTINNGPAPTCTRGFISGSTCTYQCDTGFEIVSGSIARTCSSSTRAWTGTEPTCEEISKIHPIDYSTI